MNIKFNYKTGKVFDFFYSPDYILKFKDTINDDSNYDEIIPDEFKDFIQELEIKLAPYKEKLKFYYMDNFNFIASISEEYSYFKYDSINEYTNTLSELDDSLINKSLVYSMLRSGDKDESKKELLEEAEKITKDKNNIISLIKESNLKPNEKWNLFCIIEEPKKYMSQYLQIMNTIFPIFEEVYANFEEKLIDYGTEFYNRLQENGLSLLNKISDDYFELDIFGENDVYLSFACISQYNLLLRIEEDANYLIWGLKIEEAFKNMKERNKDRLNKRVMAFKNLGDKTRYEILKMIVNEECTSKEIAKKLGITGATVSYHINNLTTSNIIKLGKKDNKYSYSLNKEFLEECIEELKKDLNI